MANPDFTDDHDGATRRSGRTATGPGHFAEASFRRLVDKSPDGIVVHRDGRVVYANQTVVRWVGALYADQVLGQPLTEFIHSDSI